MPLTQKLRTKELAEKFGVSTRTIINWATKGPDRLPGRQIGRTWSFDEAQVQDWYERQGNSADMDAAVSEIIKKFQEK